MYQVVYYTVINLLVKSYAKMSAVTEQVIAQECPICMDTIEGLCNRVVTECGHAFHCSCLMQNTAHNGFGCPYCRTKMADEPEEEEESDDGYGDDESEVTVFDSDALASFRMFHQRINGEEVEEEEAEEWATVDGEDEDADVDDVEEEESSPRPDAAYMVQKLAARGITFEDLVKNIMFQEHSNYGEHYSDYERRSSEVYGQFRAVISQYTPSEPTPAAQTPAPIVTSEPTPVALPVIAESKSAAIPRRREFMVHV
jgi:hypothetical protein